MSLRPRFKKGDRVRLIATPDAHTFLLPGATGTVRSVDGAGTIHIAWDNGGQLGMVPGIDRIARLSNQTSTTTVNQQDND